jgi:hypothetical protein
MTLRTKPLRQRKTATGLTDLLCFAGCGREQ